MRIFFVVDIKSGVVVAAKRGEREKYLPVHQESEVVDSSNPLDVVRKIKPRYLYSADLDRIEKIGTNERILSNLTSLVDEMIADCGFREPEELRNLPYKPVVGTETFDITELEGGCYVSLDFRGEFLDASGKFGDWRSAVEYLNTMDLEALIVLPIHSVGTMRPEFGLVERVLEISENPVMLGGGVSGKEDLEILKDMGCDGVLVATAVHRKKIPLYLIRRGKI